MSIVKAYFDGLAFVPIGPVSISKGKIVNLSIEHEGTITPENIERLKAFRELTNEIREINKTEPLPREFDEILADRIDFTRDLDL